MESSNDAKKTGVIAALSSKMSRFAETIKKVAKEDPRRVIHGVKVGIAVSLVSLFYYLHPLYSSLGESALWAVLTVIVLFEFSVGMTLGKGVNRMGATWFAGSLAVGAHRLAHLCGHIGQPIFVFVCGFIVAFVFTFLRFIPAIKKRYDYGLRVFILTFCLVMASHSDNKVFLTAWKRLVTILIGSLIAVGVCVFVCPVWSGQELHNLIASNLDKLACFLEAFGGKDPKDADEKYKSVITTRTTEEDMANYARWEPRHGQFRFHRHPWNHYLKIGALARQCAKKIDALNHYPLGSNGSHAKIEQLKKMCKRLSLGSGKALKGLSNGMKKLKTIPLAVKDHIKECKSTADELKSMLNSKPEPGLEGLSLVDLLPIVTLASMLIEIVDCIEEIAEAVEELVLDTSFAHLKSKAESVAAAQEEMKGVEGNVESGSVEVVIA